MYHQLRNPGKYWISFKQSINVVFIHTDLLYIPFVLQLTKRTSKK
jgi:hypothetical protein